MIDRRLNYGRDNIRYFLEQSLPFDTVLDLGAGGGFDLNSAGEVNPSARLCAVELFESSTINLRDNGVEVYDIDIERDRLPFEDESIDIVIANQILEHTKEIFWVLHETSRILKPKGKFIVGVPNLASLHNRLLLLFGKHPTQIQLFSGHIRGFTIPGLLSLLNIFAGYRVAALRGGNFYPFPPYLARPLARLIPSFAWGIFFHLEKVKEYSDEFLAYLEKENLETFFYKG